jgi:exodeoxyribonuclease V alpha subunit
MSTRSVIVPPGVTDLAPFVDAGVLGPADVHVAATLARVAGPLPTEVALGIALAVRAPGHGHVCVDLAHIARSVVVDEAEMTDLPWPEPGPWIEILAASPLVRRPGEAHPDRGPSAAPLVLERGLLYLTRYWDYEQLVARNLLDRAGVEIEPAPTEGAVADALVHLFGPTDPGAGQPDRQRQAVEVALTRRITVIGGGPGTGKTRTIARLLAVLHIQALADGLPLEVSLAAPTGKAAARMTEALRTEVAQAGLTEPVTEALAGVEARTIHRLLGPAGSGRFRHQRDNPLPHDVVVIDEASMVSLPMMAKLLDAVRPTASVILVGDPSQLASVEAGTVLGDIISPADLGTGDGPESIESGESGLRSCVVLLDRVHRFGADSAIALLADDIRTGDPARVLARLASADGHELSFVDPTDTVRRAELERLIAARADAVIHAGREGDPETALDVVGQLKLLCATRRGPDSVEWWNQRVERGLAAADRNFDARNPWYLGRPVMVTRNDDLNHLFNGDTGVVVAGGDGRRPQVGFAADGGCRLVDPARLDQLETLWAMTIHKSQGSEFDHVVVVLPPPPSPILTRELLYTAVTRARQRVTLVASEASITAAVERPVSRASGLRAKLWP